MHQKHLVAGLHPDPLGERTALPKPLGARKREGEGRKDRRGTGGRGLQGRMDRREGWGMAERGRRKGGKWRHRHRSSVNFGARHFCPPTKNGKIFFWQICKYYINFWQFVNFYTYILGKTFYLEIYVWKFFLKFLNFYMIFGQKIFSRILGLGAGACSRLLTYEGRGNLAPAVISKSRCLWHVLVKQLTLVDSQRQKVQ